MFDKLQARTLSSNQISGFFDHQYLLEESIDTFYLVHGDSHHRKVTSKTTTFGSVWPVLFILASVFQGLILLVWGGRTTNRNLREKNFVFPMCYMNFQTID